MVHDNLVGHVVCKEPFQFKVKSNVLMELVVEAMNMNNIRMIKLLLILNIRS